MGIEWISENQPKAASVTPKKAKTVKGLIVSIL
jgi:hypothetical protein